MGKELKRKRQHGQGKQQPYTKNTWKFRKTDNGPRQQHERKAQPFVPKVSLREDQVGITEYINVGAGFTGVLKSRFSDFHVNEIDLTGKVLHLTDLHIPKPAAEVGLSAEELAAARKELDGIVAADWWQQLDNLAAAKPSDTAAPIELNVSELDKDTRTKIHKVIKQIYAKRLVSTTINNEQQQLKLIRVLKPKSGNDARDRKAWGFSADFVHFLVHKENVDTGEVAAAIAGSLNMPSSGVTYCGTKDKRAKTTQKFCIKKRTPSQIVNSIRGLRNVYIGNFEFSQQVLRLGDLKGNRFRIALRHVKGERDLIAARLRSLRDNGFINYYGLQRFGNCATIPTYEIGVALLKCDYKLACELILKPRDNDVNFMREVREHWWKHRNSAEAAAMIHNKKYIEKMLLDGLAQCGEKDYATALRRIPRNMLLLYPHAFQSLVFNRMASRRIKEFGLKLIPGDLVYRQQPANDGEVIELPAEDDMERAIEATTDDAPLDLPAVSEFKDKVKPLTEADIASDKYSIFDVVLPLPGFDITYPDNVVGTWYEELLQAHELSSEKLRHNIKTFAMTGAYRKLLIKPDNMTWEFRNYKQPDETLIASDMELLRPNPRAALSNANEGDYTALLLDFCLTTSAYATMLLRELLKEDTSAAKQTEIEQAEQQKCEQPLAEPVTEQLAEPATAAVEQQPELSAAVES